MRAPRRTAAVLLAALLNLALLPCSMAFEAVGEGHDCCPPELRLDASDCCEVGDATVDARGAATKSDGGDSGEIVALAPAWPDAPAAPRYPATTGPPGDPPRAVARHKLHCVYLN
ncbi:MAG: hypothetical protein MJA32_03650 [Proteobacteria bacterium]|nr:hypothetical protein [Pseudomonadota bacterium]